jgi:molybdopterin-containing oxidoreductase family molybdopterin binding subunit
MATPAFSIIKEHVKKYTPEMASRITTVPPETIRRLAREFGEAASIGSTIVIDGKELPYRPVAVGYFRGAQAHKHSALTCMALELLQGIVGAINVPGGSLGVSSRSLGYPATGQPAYSPSEGPDGLLAEGFAEVPPSPWPTREPKKPTKLGMQDLVPTAGQSPLVAWSITEREKYKIPYKPEFIIQTGGNPIMAIADPKVWEKAFKDDIFTVTFSLYLDESAEFADIVLPDTCYLERFDIKADREASFSPVDEWAWHIRQPVVEPLFQRRPGQEVLLEIAERLDMLGDMYRMINRQFDMKAPYTLDPTKKYTWEEIVDYGLKGYFGPEHGLDWFKENGLIHWPKKVEEVYWRPFVKGRAPIYFDYFKTVGEQIEQVKKEHNIPGFDTADFQPIPDWKPCASYEERRPEYDLYGIYYRVPFHTCTATANNPWLDEVSRLDPYTNNIAINTGTAKKKGIKDGDRVVIESAGTGHKVEGRATLTEAIHPEVIAYTCSGGHWAKRLPIASQAGKGVCPEWLIPLSWDHIDTVSLNLDLCVKVKVTKKA